MAKLRTLEFIWWNTRTERTC